MTKTKMLRFDTDKKDQVIYFLSKEDGSVFRFVPVGLLDEKSNYYSVFSERNDFYICMRFSTRKQKLTTFLRQYVEDNLLSSEFTTRHDVRSDKGTIKIGTIERLY